jgi:hypothetical protein
LLRIEVANSTGSCPTYPKIERRMSTGMEEMSVS